MPSELERELVLSCMVWKMGLVRHLVTDCTKVKANTCDQGAHVFDFGGTFSRGHVLFEAGGMTKGQALKQELVPDSALSAFLKPGYPQRKSPNETWSS